MNARFPSSPVVPPPDATDRLPHDRAVWRPIVALVGAAAGKHQISIEYEDGRIVQTWMHQAIWDGAKRWRFGWAPQ